MDAKAHVRINYLDWLRVLGILFVLIYHSTRLYNYEDWNVKNNMVRIIVKNIKYLNPILNILIIKYSLKTFYFFSFF